MKLLAKNAEERYQTASGLETDLRRCLAEWQSQGCIDPFALGAHDASDRLLIPEKLYGREHRDRRSACGLRPGGDPAAPRNWCSYPVIPVSANPRW